MMPPPDASDPTPEQPTEMSLADAISAAMQMHQGGRLDDARLLYERILEAAPENADVLHFLGVLRHQQGESEAAIGLVRRATELAPQYADAVNNLGNILKELDRLDEAAAAYQRAIELNSEFAPAYNNLGIVLSARGNYEPAETALRRAIELDDRLFSAYDNLGRLLVRCGNSTEALEIVVRWNQLAEDDPIARHTLAALTGENIPDRCSDAFVEQTFDAFAVHYETVLSRLQNQGPEIMRAGLEAICSEPSGTLDVLDAGCGTGLCGPVLRPYARRLVGVDLSGGMLSKVPAGSYDELVQAELSSFLASNPDSFDVIVSSDTLNYFGDLGDVMNSVRTALRTGGVLVATLEHAEDSEALGGFDLQDHGRYRHARGYLEQAVRTANLDFVGIEIVTMRTEGGEPVAGMLLTVRKNPG